MQQCRPALWADVYSKDAVATREGITAKVLMTSSDCTLQAGEVQPDSAPKGKKRGRKPGQKNTGPELNDGKPPPESASEAAERMLAHKKLHSKLNLDVLEHLFDEKPRGQDGYAVQFLHATVSHRAYHVAVKIPVLNEVQGKKAVDECSCCIAFLFRNWKRTDSGINCWLVKQECVLEELCL